MSRGTLKFLAGFLGILIVCVLLAGFDNLPRGVRAEIDSERRAFADAQKQVQGSQAEVNRDLAAEADLFRAVPASQQWPGGLSRAAGELESAGQQVAELTALEKANRRTDRQRAESLLASERGLRTAATADASAVQKDAAHWIELKQHLPQALQGMERDYQAARGFDLAPVAASVQRAETDWPDKKPDLESRLNALRGVAAESESMWQASAEARRRASAGDLSGIALVSADADSLKSHAADLPAKADELKSLAGQLYYSWDKVLVDLEVRGIGTNRSFDEKIRTVRTRVPDAAAKSGESTSEDKWVEVPRGVYEAQKNDLGMAVEHKPAGRYDSEAERMAQPAGFAYMATPAQGSNQYGRWEHRDGRDFWVFYGQYALMRDLLFNHNYRPLDRGEWDGYRTSRESGHTYYGRDEQAGAPKYGSQGTATQDRYAGSSYAQSGGFRDSKYASKSGSYRDSQYASPSARDPNADHGARQFGTNRSEEPRAARPPSGGFRPAPRSAPSFRPPMRSLGRTFGRRH
jgi:hypothetical protein